MKKNIIWNLSILMFVGGLVIIFIMFNRPTLAKAQEDITPVAIIPKSAYGCKNVLVDMGNDKFLQCGRTAQSMTVNNVEYIICDCVDGK